MATVAPAPPDDAPSLLTVRGLTKHFPVKKGFFRRVVGHVHAVDGVSFTIREGETYALVGESGCGKTTTGRLVLRLEEPDAGEVFFDGTDVLALRGEALRRFRRRMQIVFQDPYASLDPRQSVGDAVGEGLALHEPGLAHDAREARVREMLTLVGLPAGAAERFPHEFSGGQRQRACIARALAVGPRFLVCDEAVSALDVSIQAQIVNLFEDLRARLGLAYLFISHDLAVVRHLAHRVGVMYLGELVEEAPAEDLFARPRHPYTRALLSAIPDIDPARRGQRMLLKGQVPPGDKPPPGCRFHPRCPHAMPRCLEGAVPETEPAPRHRVRCWLSETTSP